MQGRNKEIDIENGLEDTEGVGKGKLGRSESSIDVHTLPNVNRDRKSVV